MPWPHCTMRAYSTHHAHHNAACTMRTHCTWCTQCGAYTCTAACTHWQFGKSSKGGVGGGGGGRFAKTRAIACDPRRFVADRKNFTKMQIAKLPLAKMLIAISKNANSKNAKPPLPHRTVLIALSGRKALDAPRRARQSRYRRGLYGDCQDDNR